jgi:tetratricopeptide (TPR) repeat protein
MARGEWSQAEASFKQAIALSPHATVFSNLGALYLYLGRYADAIPVLEQATALGSGDHNAYLIWGNLGDAYKWAGRQPETARAYTKAIDLAATQLSLNPNNGTLLGQLAVFYAKMGDAPRAEDCITSAVKLAPRDPGTLYRSAIVWELAGRRKQSLAALDAALSSGYSPDVARHEPELASLRNDSGYRAVAAHAKEQEK